MRLHQHQFFLGNFQMLNHQQNYFGMVFFSSFPQVTNGGQMRVIRGSKLHRDDRHSQWLTGEVKVGRLWKIFPRPNHHVGGWGKRAGSDTPDDQILSSDKKDVKTNIKCHSTSTSRKIVAFKSLVSVTTQVALLLCSNSYIKHNWGLWRWCQ